MGDDEKLKRKNSEKKARLTKTVEIETALRIGTILFKISVG